MDVPGTLAPQQPAVEPAVPAPKDRLWGGWATVGFGAAIFALHSGLQVFVTFIFLGVMMASNPSLRPNAMLDAANNGFLLALATIVAGIAATGLIIGFIKVRRGATLTGYLGLHWPRWKPFLIWLAVVLAVSFASDAITVLLRKPVNPQFMVEAYRTSLWPPLLWIAVVVFAPLFEEAFFRGFLLVGLRNSRAGAIGAVAITSIGWASLHVQYEPYLIGTILVTGIVLGVMRLRTGSLWAPLAAHALLNLIAMVQTALNVNEWV